MNLLEQIFGSVLDTSWKVSFLALFLLLIRWCLRRRAAARLWFCVWVAVAVRLLLPISVPAAWSPYRLATWRHASGDAVTPTMALLGAGETRIATPINEPRGERAGVSLFDLRPAQFAALTWGVGIALLVSARIFACVRFTRRVQCTAVTPSAAALPEDLAKLLEERSVKLVVTKAVSIPGLHGALRPRILFPPGLLEALSPAEVRLTIAHELAHARRRDLLADLLMHVAAIVHWFNPIVWFTVRTARHDCELACDEFVVRRANESERESYGATLLRLASMSSQRGHGAFGLGVVSAKHQIKRRIQMIIGNRSFTLPGTVLSATLSLAGIGFSFTSETVAQPARTPEVTTSSTVTANTEESGIRYDSTTDRLDVLFPTGIVATVHDRTITVADVRRHIAPMIPLLKRDSRNQGEFNGRLAMLRNTAIKDLVDRIVLVRQFHDSHAGEEPKIIASQYIDRAFTDELNERFGGDRSKFLDYLRDCNMTVHDYQNDIEEQIIYNYMRNQERKIAGKTAPIASSAPAATVDTQQSIIKLIAKETITVTVRVANGPEQSDGSILFEGTINAGETREVARPGLLMIECQSLDNLVVEIAGKQYNAEKIVGPGHTKVLIQAPHGK